MKEIKFLSHRIFIEDKETRPYPSKKHFPEWWKKIPPHSVEKFTIKGCMPVTDSIGAGYIIPMPQDMHVRYGCDEEGNRKNGPNSVKITFSQEQNPNFNLLPPHFSQQGPNAHGPQQIGGDGSFYTKKQEMGSFAKITNPWVIKTPPGYSCLIISPMHREFDKINILPAIVDTDKFENQINFPFHFNKKYLGTIFTVEKGTPIAQIIPFKRDSWKMKLRELNLEEHAKKDFFYFSKVLHRYRNINWTKKEWN